MNETMIRKQVHQAVDSHCAHLKDDYWLAQRVIAMAREQEAQTIVRGRRKLPVMTVVVLVLVLLTATATAATLIWRQYAIELAHKEHEQGSYQEWPAQDRIDLVKSLMEMGYIDEAEESARLLAADTPAEERQALADELVLSLIGENNIAEVDLYTLTYAIMGYQDFWTPEQRIWWQDVTNMYRTSDNPDTLVLPCETDLSVAQAISIAGQAIIEAYQLDEHALNEAQPVANLYVTVQRPNYRRWSVQFKFYEEGTEHYEIRQYRAIIDATTGEVIGDADIQADSVYDIAARKLAWDAGAATELNPIEASEIYGKYSRQDPRVAFRFWSAELKAAYSAEVKPAMTEFESFEDATRALSWDVVYSTIYTYGMPGEDEVQRDDALHLARQAMQTTYHLSDDDMRYYSNVNEAYDITNPEAPMWKFTFYNEDDYYGSHCRVLLNGKTGEINFLDLFNWWAWPSFGTQEFLDKVLPYYY